MFFEVKEILNDEERCILEWILGCYKYTDIVKGNMAKANKEKIIEVHHSNDEYIEILKQWKKNKIEPTRFSLPVSITAKELEELRDALIMNELISDRTTPEIFKYVLGSGKICYGYEPIIWLKQKSRKKPL